VGKDRNGGPLVERECDAACEVASVRIEEWPVEMQVPWWKTQYIHNSSHRQFESVI